MLNDFRNSTCCPCSVGDRWRVLLWGDTEDYIHAVAVNVRQ